MTPKEICIRKIKKYFLIFFIFIIGVAFYNNFTLRDDSESLVVPQQSTEQQSRTESQEIANLKMTVSTFEKVISNLQADNIKLSEIIENHSPGIDGGTLLWLLLLTSALSIGLVILYNTLNKGIL